MACSPKCRWGTSVGFCWLIVAIATIYVHYAVDLAYQPISSMRSNLRTGFYEVLRLDYLEADAYKIRNASAQGLASCDVMNATGVCATQSYPSPVPIDRSEHAEAELNNITAAFENSVKTIEKVATDKYLGTSEMETTAEGTRQISIELENLKNSTVNGTIECVASNPIFCNMHENAMVVVGSMDEATSEIDKLLEGDDAKKMDELSEGFEALHVVPWFLCVAVVFQTLYLCRTDGSRSCFNCCCHIPMFICWLVCFVASSVLFFGFIATMHVAENEKIKDTDGIKGEPTLVELLDHIKTEYPAFWDVVFKDLMVGLEACYGAFFVLWVVCVAFFIHMCCMCCCLKPQKKSGEQ